ncbi:MULTISPECIES: PLP-dependent cysteine synthase family protein [unclassified Rhodococcus (in: high G+C Gram-positive bacteria)]|uniref:PLP-dependent cysteine synthase family protein n=1 Tax=unclassified Rhodococcus (in: high G+C Gram-positive bacteria) TaxID=192944 RepID=UPI0004808ECB|nr:MULTISPECIES: PLP-dependent cysteine synthase family protein [unclassified Rhodococcus (in: high G+C Gram-positive bacteria)]MDQ1182644.1 cysteine synthase A [Rhodococcus sp. SORGH_AS_0301]
MTVMRIEDRSWVENALRIVEADANRSADTHLHPFPLPAEWGIDLYLKDESVHPTGSLKHRLARSLFLFGLANGDIGPRTTLVEASSGSTAVSEAYFARLIGLEFVAVMPATTSPTKIALIERYGGICRLVEHSGAVYDVAEELGAQKDWLYLDQFTNASVVTDWRGNNSIAASIFDQMALERFPVPTWVVVGAGTGGTSATIGRYCRYRRVPTRVCVVDPEGSAFFEAWRDDTRDAVGTGSRIEGIGRPRVEPSFVPAVIEHMVQIPDAASVAAVRMLDQVTGLHAGGSTGTNLVGAFRLAADMKARGEQGSIVTLLCDGGERYEGTYYDDAWVSSHGMNLDAHRACIDHFLATGVWSESV